MFTRFEQLKFELTSTEKLVILVETLPFAKKENLVQILRALNLTVPSLVQNSLQDLSIH